MDTVSFLEDAKVLFKYRGGEERYYSLRQAATLLNLMNPGQEYEEEIEALLEGASLSQYRQAMVGLGMSIMSFDVKTYGATGNGLVDDTSAIHAAITDAKLYNGQVYFPAGTYKCNLVVTGNIRLIGAGGGDPGDWTGGVAARTRLIPNSDASPIVSVSNTDGFEMHHMELKGNGNNVSSAGLKISAPGGYYLHGVNIRGCAKNFWSVGGCNMQAYHCGFFQGTVNIYIEDTGLAHSYLFALCSIGGDPATGNGRCFEVLGGSFITVLNCEQGNCYDYYYSTSNGQNFVCIGSNFESFSSDRLMTYANSTVSFNGTRMAVASTVLARISTQGSLDIAAMRISVPTNIEHDGLASININSSGGNFFIKEYTTGFGALTGTGQNRKIKTFGRLTVDQAIAGAGTTVVKFNTLTTNGVQTYDSATGIFKPNKSGYYHVSASLRLSAVAGGYSVLRFTLNGSEISNPAFITTGGAGTTICGSDIIFMDANDELAIALVTGGACTVQASSGYSTKFAIVELP